MFNAEHECILTSLGERPSARRKCGGGFDSARNRSEAAQTGKGLGTA